ncbi:glycoside hydrolase family 97 catalytic domain-containing protein [Aestuariibaculum sp. YM273]|uniref:glycoside hydrolase family 97 protein n=1 Tax=Aestuariibaculum sp. YM273 TaxID=3070659 RepID=UPI0027DDDF3C|nr:glycoside hydrolase family 97 protein [Aestuariibaculum sp. YM273]WMI65217.1 glycoside hydrolase family 97 catalytic domain-containing protein [Aestuariibaculum sp. YM273]
MMKFIKTTKAFTTFFFLTITQLSLAQMPIQVASPDGETKTIISLDEGNLFYQVSLKEETFLEPSALGVKTSLGDFYKELSYVSHSTNQIKTSYKFNKGKASHINYIANEVSCQFTNTNQDTLYVIFRVSDNNVAFSYRIRTKERSTNIKVFEEITAFNIPNNATTYITPQAPPMTGWELTKPSYEEVYTFGESINKPSLYGLGYTFPALFKVNKTDGWILISETGVDSNYLGARLGEPTKDGVYKIEFPQEGENNGIGGTFAVQAMPLQTPWRTITMGNTLKPIVESTITFDLVEPLYPPSKEYKMGRASWSWIVWQDQSINYEDQVKYIDLASALKLEYVLIDNWWDRGIGKERMPQLIEYANSKGVDVLLWYNSNGYWNNAPQTPQDKMDSAPARQREMAWLESIGVKGLKVDFFGGDKQNTIKLYEDILTDANKYGLAITFHGCTLPRGWEKMYPNYVTSEAVKASEMLYFDQLYADDYAKNATIFPFTRNVVGAMDFAPVFFNKRLGRDETYGTTRRTTDAFEVATSVLFLSPIQHFGITPNNLEEQPKYVLDFISQVPTVWDETIYIGGEPGDYCALARRKGSKWYVAVVNGKKEARKIELDLPMLNNSKASMIYDNEDRTAGYKNVEISKTGKMTIQVLSEGGVVIFN